MRRHEVGPRFNQDSAGQFGEPSIAFVSKCPPGVCPAIAQLGKSHADLETHLESLRQALEGNDLRINGEKIEYLVFQGWETCKERSTLTGVCGLE